MARNQRSSYLPQELVTQVLVRLPVKSLGRFKCVCKEWFTLIGGPQFAESHLQLSLHARGIIYQQEKTGKVSYVDLDVERGVVSNFDFNVKEIFRDFVFLIKDSCNGLILFETAFSERQYYVCNPITQRYSKLYYVCNPITQWYSKLPQFFYGHTDVGNWPASLCYDSLNQKYKVLIVFKDRISSYISISYKCAVFTLGNKDGGGDVDGDSNSSRSSQWRVIDIPVTSGEITPAMHPINGAIYWMIEGGPLTKPSILRMDLASEEFSLIDIPTTSWNYATIHKMNGSLCLAVSVPPYQLDLWVLNDAVKQAWSKEFSINFRSIIDKFDLFDFRFCTRFFITEHPRPLIIFFGIQKMHFYCMICLLSSVRW